MTGCSVCFFKMNLVLLAGSVEGVAGLFGDFCKGYEADAGHPVWQGVLTNYFRKVLAAGGTRICRIRHGDKKALSHFVMQFRGVEINPAARGADGAAQIFEVFLFGVGWTDEHQLSDLAAAAATAFGKRRSSGCTACGCLLQGFLPDGHAR